MGKFKGLTYSYRCVSNINALLNIIGKVNENVLLDEINNYQWFSSLYDH